MTQPSRTRPLETDLCAWLGQESHPLHVLSLCAADLFMARLRLEKLAAELAAQEPPADPLEEHAPGDPITELRRVIHCVVADRLTPAIQDLYDFLLAPLSGGAEDLNRP